MNMAAKVDERALQAAIVAVPLTRWVSVEYGGWTNEDIARRVVETYLRAARGCLVCGGVK